ncbi:MAG: sugar transferase [Coriobacteriia bacterium]|nr:sugar transferase [Coriobacteriia bacterium]
MTPKGPTVVSSSRVIEVTEEDLDAAAQAKPQQPPLDPGRFVAAGCAYDIDSTEPQSAEDVSRAARIHEAVDNYQATGIEHRLAYRFIKRTFDIVFSLLVMVAFCWLYAIIAIAIKVDDPAGPVIFRQQRIGKNGKPFTMFKFRSMCADAEERWASLRELNEKSGPVFKIANDPRITRVGRVIRKCSIDELPQFVNVLMGQMTTVGPRPALPREVATYTDYQKQRLVVKPGLTCYWQTRLNRDSISFDEWVDWDLLYIKQCNVWVDFKLVVQTIGVILTAQGD